MGDNEGVVEDVYTFHIQIPNSARENGFATWQFVLENEEWLDDDYDDGTDLMMDMVDLRRKVDQWWCLATCSHSERCRD